MNGVVIKWVDNRGFGFIAADSSLVRGDIWFHRESIAGQNGRNASMQEGDRVTFDTDTRDDRLVAVNVRRALDFTAAKEAARA
jgi:cold shock CspA family protein